MKLTGEVHQHTTKHIRFSSDEVLKHFGIDPLTHDIRSISRSSSMFHANHREDMIEIVVVERPETSRRQER